MYIDVALINDFMKRYPSILTSQLEDIIEQCGVWSTVGNSRALMEDFEITLEELCNIYYFVIEKNKMFFVNPDEFWDDVEEYFSST